MDLGKTGRLKLNIFGNYVVKGAAMILSLLTMPAYLVFFTNQADLGVWFTMTSFLNWILLFDFGIGGGLRNQIVGPLQRNDYSAIRRILTSAYASTGIVVLAIISIACVVVPAIDWSVIVGKSDGFSDPEYLAAVVFILIVGVAIRFSTVLVTHLLYAMQKAVAPNIVLVSSNMLILCYLVFANATGIGNDALSLATATSVANNLPAFVTTFVVLRKSFPWYRPKITDINSETVHSLLGVGGWIFYLQIVIALLFNVKEPFITWFVNSAEVVDYQIYYKIIGMVGSLSSLALVPIWSAVTQSAVQGDWAWIKRLVRKGFALIALASVLQLAIIPLFPIVIHYWVGDSAVDISNSALLIFCVYNAFYMVVMLVYNVGCGLGMLRPQALFLTISAILGVILAAVIGSVWDNWSGVIMASVLAMIPSVAVLPFMLWRRIGGLSTEARKNGDWR